jgi:hypothetical protein
MGNATRPVIGHLMALAGLPVKSSATIQQRTKPSRSISCPVVSRTQPLVSTPTNKLRRAMSSLDSA